MADWLTIEVYDGPFPASQWQRAHESQLVEAAITHGASTWNWHSTAWGVVFEILFEQDVRLESYRRLALVRAALDAVPDRVNSLLVYRGPGGASAAGLPRRPHPAPMAGAAALPQADPDSWLELSSDVAELHLAKDRDTP